MLSVDLADAYAAKPHEVVIDLLRTGLMTHSV